MSLALEKLKHKLRDHLIQPNFIDSSNGIKTGDPSLNQYLLEGGIAKSSLSLISGEPGSGITKFFCQTANNVLDKSRWVAWVGQKNLIIQPHFFNKDHLSKLLYIETPRDKKKLLWVLQELLSLSFFDLIGCELNQSKMPEHSLIQLKKMVKQQHTPLIFLDHTNQQRVSSSYSLALELTPSRIFIKRALQRSTPHSMERRFFYEDTMSELTSPRKSICC